MKEEEVKKISSTPHKITIDGRQSATVTGVIDMDSFNENEIIFITSCGAVTLTGTELHVSRLSLDDGQLWVTGEIQSVDYSDHEEKRAKGFMKRAFQ